MIVVILQNPDITDPARQNAKLEVRMMIEGITLDEADKLGQAIHEFALAMDRRETLSAFQLQDELVRN